MSHVFVLRGDLTNLECDAWMLPTDSTYSVTAGWLRAVPGIRERIDLNRDPAFERHEVLAQALPPVADEARVVLTAVPLHGFRTAAELRPALEAFFAVAANQSFERNEAKDARRRRARPLIALPSFGTDGGGGRLLRGAVLTLLFETAQQVADTRDVDVALVFRDPASHALAQRFRQKEQYAWSALRPDLLDHAKRLSEVAASGRLVPFMGSGVSVSAGGPDWAGLIDGIAEELEVEPALRAQLVDSRRDVLDQAAALRAFFDQEERDTTFNELIADQVHVQKYGLAPALLAQLTAEEAITLNYDTLFERAALDVGLPRRVIPTGGDADDPSARRWVLKLHGSVEVPETIVLTRDDYLGFNEDRAALSSLVKATLLTRHLLFVGFGLKDDHFHEILYDVRRAVREGSKPLPKLGTVVRLFADPLDPALWGESLEIISLADEGSKDVAAAARHLEIFLDALLCFAGDSDAYLLTPGFEDVLTEAETALRAAILRLEAEVSPAEKKTAAWHVMERALAQLRSVRPADDRPTPQAAAASRGDAWRDARDRPRVRAGDLVGATVPDEPGVYAWFRGDECVYVGIAGSLRRRLANHRDRGVDLSRSTFRASVAVHLLGVTRRVARARPPVLPAALVEQVNEWIADCEVSWQTTPSRDAARALERVLLDADRPRFNLH